jgi:hypothetical protein
MTRFINPHYSRYPLSFHIGYHQTAQDIISDAGTLKTADPTLNDLWNLHTVYLKQERAMEMYNEREVNREIKSSVKMADSKLSVIRSLLNVAIRTPDIVSSAERIKDALKEFGNIAGKNANEQESDLLTFCLACSSGGGLYNDATVCGISDSIAALNTLRGIIRNRLDDKRNMEEALPAKSTKEVRKLIDDNLGAMFVRIEGLQDFGATSKVQAIAATCTRDINVETENANKRYDRKKKSLKGHVIAVFPTESPATGNPITPLPEGAIWYEVYNSEKVLLEKVELFLGKDFELSYRNNVKPGKAYILVHGKGIYSGTEEFPFVII